MIHAAPQPKIEQPMYPVQVVLGDGSLAIRLGEIIEWFEHRGIEPKNIRYSMAADHIRLRVDLPRRADAVAFLDVFGDVVVETTNRSVPARGAGRRRQQHSRASRQAMGLAAD
jgi:hypothetical protein